jgi:hypothetical protein
MTELINPKVTFHDDIDNALVVKQEQKITDDFLKDNADLRLASSAPAGNFHKFASIPTVVVEKWMREGFDILKGKHTAKEIMDRLRSEDLTAFITTNKRL